MFQFNINTQRTNFLNQNVKGFGHTGIGTTYVTWGPTAQAVSGCTQMSGQADLEPAGWGFSYLDHSAGYYGAIAALLALVERRFNKAVELCRAAVKEEFFSPDLYRNLARVHLVFGFKAEAIRYLRRGLMIDPGSEEILGDLADLGLRRRPVLGFLPRRHFVNRWLGRLRPQVEPTGAEVGQAG